MDGMSLERIGNLHLVFLHLPIGFVAAAVLIELWSWRRASTEVARLQGRLLATNAIATVLTAGLGLLLASGGDYAGDTLNGHRWAGVACAGLSIAVWMMYARGMHRAARGVLAALLGCTVAAGHLGGTLTHGTATASWWRAPVVAPRPEKTVVAATPVESSFDNKIRPLLERSCVDCHGPDKTKGRLRLDLRERALAGGKSGEPSIVPGKPEESELLRRVKLPRDDENAMPPEGESALSAAEIKALEDWIAAGAKW